MELEDEGILRTASRFSLSGTPKKTSQTLTNEPHKKNYCFPLLVV